ncbi:response regulator [Shimia sp. R11_0]|uniref:PAS domain-containing hybrid sensor histidine kinase/response regulator n=1 Tax=Shimia sp. R11_0 TaxID=2821096 RepID=UPI001AD9CC20|nr:ATP-binding protein [Shimia sp. R11_0]MBO9475951.1 response regulator [Shimia sp. R11_0]
MTADSKQKLLHDSRQLARLKELLVQYAEDRLSTLRRRLVVYALALIAMTGATDLRYGLAATLILLIGEWVDCYTLRQVAPRIAAGAPLVSVQRLAAFAGIMQALSLSIGAAIYVFAEGNDSSILGVAAAFGMGTVNAALILPTNPRVAILKMAVFMITPVLMLTYKTFLSPSALSLDHIDFPMFLVLLSMGYMCYSFATSGFHSYRQNEALRRSQLNLSDANEELGRHQHELQKLSMVARQTNDAVLLMTPERSVEWVNEAFCRLSRLPKEHSVGKPFEDLLAMSKAPPEVLDGIATAARNAVPHRAELAAHMPEGNVIWTDLHILPVTNGDNVLEFIVAIARDITHIKEHSESLRAARVAAEDAAKAKADFLANMSHEIRTPMTGIMGMADLLSQTHQTPEQREYTQTIIGSSRSLLTIINDILDLSKMDAGKMEISETEFRVRECFEETVRLLSPTVRDKGLDMTLHFDEDLPDVILSDDVRIRQLATNIIGNAAKFTEHGQIDIHVWSEQEDTDEGGTECSLHFVVEDTGIGIPEDKLATIFDEFSQAENSTTRRFGGTGLGLTICQVLVSLMGGTIGVTSTYGAGSSFQISLPIRLPEAGSDALVPFASAEEVEDFNLQDLEGLRVLVAEDNQTNRLLLKKFLETLPIHLHFAHDGYEAVEAALQHAPDLIFMDMSMPNMSGLDATEAIRGSSIEQPVIVALTANVFDSERQACLSAGMDDFLTKPIRKEDLIACLLTHLGPQSATDHDTQSALNA